MNMRAIIVDDEELARRGIRALLKRAGDVEIVSECGSCEEAIKAISAAEPELVYLDIQMQGKTGFDVIAALPKPNARMWFSSRRLTASRCGRSRRMRSTFC